MSDMDSPLFRIRVLDGVSGAIISDNLPHVGATYTDVAYQAGQQAFGSFSIDLVPRSEPAGFAAWSTYEQLGYPQRVEFYELGVTQPVFTGVIETVELSSGSSTKVSGYDSLWLLTVASTMREEAAVVVQAGAGSLTNDLLFRYALSGWTQAFGEDWSTGASVQMNQYESTDVAAVNYITEDGMPGVQVQYNAIPSGQAGKYGLQTNTSFAASEWADSYASVYLHLEPVNLNSQQNVSMALWLQATNLGGSATTVGLYLTTNDVNSSTTGLVPMAANFAAFNAGAGSYINNSLMTAVMVPYADSNWRVQVGLRYKNLGSSKLWIGLYLNEQYTGLGGTVVNGTLATQAGTLALSLRSSSTLAVSEFATQLLLDTRISLFQAGTVTAGQINLPTQPTLAAQTSWKLLQQACDAEGYVVTKQTGIGLHQDTLSYGPVTSLCTDRSQTLILTESQNVLSASQKRANRRLVTDMLATGATSGGASGSAMRFRARAIQAASTLGILTSQLSGAGVTSYQTLKALGNSTVLARSQTAQSRKLAISNDVRTRLKFAVGDWVGVVAPSIGLDTLSKRRVMSIRVTEGTPRCTLTLDDIGEINNVAVLQDMRDQLHALSAGGITSLVNVGIGGNGLVVDRSSGSVQAATLTSNGATTLSGGATVSGGGTLSGEFDIQSGGQIAALSGATIDVRTGGTLQCDSGSTLTVNGTTTFNSTPTFGSGLTVTGGTLSAHTPLYGTSSTGMQQHLYVFGDLTASGDRLIDGWSYGMILQSTPASFSITAGARGNWASGSPAVQWPHNESAGWGGACAAAGGAYSVYDYVTATGSPVSVATKSLTWRCSCLVPTKGKIQRAWPVCKATSTIPFSAIIPYEAGMLDPDGTAMQAYTYYCPSCGGQECVFPGGDKAADDPAFGLQQVVNALHAAYTGTPVLNAGAWL